MFAKKTSLLRVDLPWVMAPEELLIILCVHGSKHAWERLKWVVDVAELLRSQRLNWKRVFSTATKWKCRRMALLGLAFAMGLWKSASS